MIAYPEINPVAFHIGPLSIYWYGLMYLFAFLTCSLLLHYRLRHSPFSRGFKEEDISDLVFYSALGVIIGGRLGYMFFYNLDVWLQHPLALFQIWKGGMSFHGGLIGVIIALAFYSYKIGKPLVAITDFIAPVVPIGLAFGRLGNFINGELWGRETTVPWAMIFPGASNVPRHPSPLYEFFFEGVLLFIILWFYSAKPRPLCAVSGLFLIFYGLFRFSLEFFREPDLQMGFVAFNWMTEGQLLSIPMFILGVGLFVFSHRGKKTCNNI